MRFGSLRTIEPPPGTIVLPPRPAFAVDYEQTTRYHWPLLTQRNTSGYVGEGSPRIVHGPFGFDEGVQFQKEQCLVKSDFPQSGDECVGHPGKCDSGLSFSIWEKVVYGQDVLNVHKLHEKKYIFSTGGDQVDDKAYPGIALYHQGIDLIAIVSTGEDVWHLRVTGQLRNQTWSNIGIRWEPFDDAREDDKGGLEMYVNQEKVGHSLAPLPRPHKDALLRPDGEWKPAPPMPAVRTVDEWGEEIEQEPPFVMVGCHRNSEDDQFRDFSYSGSIFDELAIWPRKLQINRTHDETLYFLGGYIFGYEDLTRDEWTALLDGIVMEDFAQAEIAAILTQRLFFAPEVETTDGGGEDEEEDDGTGGSGDGADGGSGSGSGSGDQLLDQPEGEFSTWPNYPRTAREWEDYVAMKKEFNTVAKLLTLTGLRPVVRPKDLRRAFNVLGTGSEPLANIPANVAGWKSIQLDPREPGSVTLVDMLDTYGLEYVSSAYIDYIESYTPIFDAGSNEMVVHASSDAMVMSIVKAHQDEFTRRNGKSVLVNSFYSGHPFHATDAWDRVEETVEVPAELNFNNNTFCRGFPVTFLTAVYDGYGRFAPLRRNPHSIRSKKFKVDGRGVSVKMQLGLDTEDSSRNSSGCVIDREAMKYNPVRVKFSHFDKSTALRKLLAWAAEEFGTNIYQRKCAIWNEEIGTTGAWDGDLCTTVLSEQDQTICECSAFGTVTVVAELTEDPYWPPEDNWLKIVKVIGFIISILCLLFFVYIILSSPVIWDMSHILLLNAGVTYLFGTFFFALTHSRSLCSERPANIFASTFMQFFYGAAACSVHNAAFAAFRAVTMGIIGGKTSSYLLLSYGAPLFNVGLTFFMYGDDYGTDPRCFVGWNNETKQLFFSLVLPVITLSTIVAIVILANVAAPRTRKDSIIDHLSAQSQGVAAFVLLHSMAWAFAYPAVIRFPDADSPDFWPIFALLNSWMGALLLVFLGLSSSKFRAAMMGAKTRDTAGMISYMDKKAGDKEAGDDATSTATPSASATPSATRPSSVATTEALSPDISSDEEEEEEEEVGGVENPEEN